MRIPIIISILLLSSSCGEDEHIDEQTIHDGVENAQLSMESKKILGNRLFSEKTCIKCHAVEKRKRGPSVRHIMKVYRENDGDIVSFLKGESEHILDENDSLVAVMQANIDGFLKEISDTELDALKTYMMHVDDLTTK